MIAKYANKIDMPEFRKFLQEKIKGLKETANTLTMLIHTAKTNDEVADLLHEREELEAKIAKLELALRQRGVA